LMGNDTGEEGLRILIDIRDNQRYKLQTLEYVLVPSKRTTMLVIYL
jgi:hypothetical protein